MKTKIGFLFLAAAVIISSQVHAGTLFDFEGIPAPDGFLGPTSTTVDDLTLDIEGLNTITRGPTGDFLFLPGFGGTGTAVLSDENGVPLNFFVNSFQTANNSGVFTVSGLLDGVEQFSIDIDGNFGGEDAFVTTDVASTPSGALEIDTLVLDNTGGGVSFPSLDNLDITAIPVPEPASLALLGLGGLSIGLRRRR